ncbi:MAG: hypothetical protein JO328_03255 [Hyphomicrobiales bacterium]|nr:hypothetical protein [Hyphomicrobiales bacterium]MBV8825264.1 hypothetical protein [Hyphomicrobiales bacterium]MBV9429154.1 hypothetical protein [Bradyrhizobiaceae bacterium]
MRAFGLACLLLGMTGVLAAQQQQQDCNVFVGWWESPDLKPIFTPDPTPQKEDCDFQIWSWTTFAHWVQKDKTGQPAFLQLPTYGDLVSGNPARMAVGPRVLILRPRNEKAKSTSSVHQPSGGVLVDQNGRAVYYATHMDPIYFAFTQKYFGPNNYKKASPTLTYPLNATVFKTSWRIVQANEDTSKVFTTKAAIDLLESDGNGGVKLSGKIQSDVTVALVGMHVVGVVKGHPEFAWATFEQIDNAPDLPAGMNPRSPDPVNTNSFTFYKGGTPANASNVLSTNLTIDPNTQVISPITNVFRQFEYGGASAIRVADIVSMNQHSRSEITARKGEKVDTVFAHYRLIGTAWMLANTLKPGDGNMASEAIGSIDLANATLETFVQGAGNNCFGCHDTSGGSGYPGKDINQSHIILSKLPPDPRLLEAR